MKDSRKLTIMVSSTVYGIEDLLDQIYTHLTAYGYEVWMSHKGTVPVDSSCTAFKSCLDAVDKCDLFLGLITPQYGSGKDRRERSITHQEILRAIKLKKPRWILAHDHVVFARSLLENMGYKGKKGRKTLSIKKSQIMDDLRVIDMYEDAIISQKPLRHRNGNWVQKYDKNNDAILFTTAQFSRFQEADVFVQENFEDMERVNKALKDRGGHS